MLEKSYFCSIANNYQLLNTLLGAVVICLKNRTFAVSQTTSTSSSLLLYWLWFAWKIVLLQYRKQHHPINHRINKSCDLLEKSYFCSIANNDNSYCGDSPRVVICLKNRTFAVSQTTNFLVLPRSTGLWFAWKIVLLQYRKQLAPGWKLIGNRCDLLEKSYFCSIANNPPTQATNPQPVVICLKNRTFAVSQTTSSSEVYLSSCCDLLEKSYFCSIANNWVSLSMVLNSVVICLKNRTFAVSQTT